MLSAVDMIKICEEVSLPYRFCYLLLIAENRYAPQVSFEPDSDNIFKAHFINLR